MAEQVGPLGSKDDALTECGATGRMGRAVPLIALTYVVIGLSYQVLLAVSTSEGTSFRIIIFIPFILAFAGGAVGIWRRARWGRVVGLVSSVLFVALGLPYNVPIFLNPADPLFLGVWTGNLALVVVAAYIASSFIVARRRSTERPK